MEKQKLTELVEPYIMQEMQDLFIFRSNISTCISDCDGQCLTNAYELCDFCVKYIKRTAEGKRRCDKCDVDNANVALKEGRAISYKCHAGLIDVSAPIRIGDELYGYIVGGQVCLEPLSKEKMVMLT